MAFFMKDVNFRLALLFLKKIIVKTAVIFIRENKCVLNKQLTGDTSDKRET